MSGEAVRIYLETIAKGDGAKRVAEDLKRVSQEAAKVAPTSRNNAQALLETSRAFEDMQYGIRGVLNNIPSLVQSLGMGAGMAGGISIAAVAATALLPKLSEWLGLTEALDEALGGTARRLREQADAAGAKLTAALGMATKESDAFAAQQYKEEQATKAANDELERSAQLLETRAKIQMLQEDAALAAEVENIKAQKLSAKDETAAIAKAKLGSAQRKAATEEQARQGQMQLATAGRDQAFGNLAGTTAERQRLQQQKIDAARYESNLAGAANLRSRIDEGRAVAVDDPAMMERINAQIADMEAQLAALEAENNNLINRTGTIPSFQAADQARLDAVREQEKKQAEQLRQKQDSLVNLEASQKNARELSAAQLGIMGVQNMRAQQGAAPMVAPPLPGAFNPLPSNGAAPASNKLPAAPGALPGDVKKLEEAFKAMTDGIANLTKMATATAQKLRQEQMA